MQGRKALGKTREKDLEKPYLLFPLRALFAILPDLTGSGFTVVYLTGPIRKNKSKARTSMREPQSGGGAMEVWRLCA